MRRFDQHYRCKERTESNFTRIWIELIQVMYRQNSKEWGEKENSCRPKQLIGKHKVC